MVSGAGRLNAHSTQVKTHDLPERRDDGAMKIEPLPDVTRTRLRSTQILTSLSQIVSELLQNSLDADARQIDIGVDCEEWICWVRDDGSGMSKDGMDILSQGLEAGRYGTSKAYSPDSLDSLSTFGFRGEALASCADICCLEISSRTLRSRQTWSVIVKGSKALYNGPATRWRRESPGTTVCIRDAFYNASQRTPGSLPVRRLSHPTPARTLDAIRRQIEAFALVFPNVSFTLENTHSLKDEKDILLKIPKTTSMLTTFRHLYGRALAQHVDEIDVASEELRLEGFISLDGAQSKAYQFLYINRHPISPCELHHAIDSCFVSSSFAKNAFDEAGETNLRSTSRRSPRKAEKKPVYVLNLTVPPQQIDNCLEPAKAAVHLRNNSDVTALLSSTIQSFLTRHSFATEHKPTAADRGSPSPRKRRKYDFEGDSGYAELGPVRPASRQVSPSGSSRGASPVHVYTREATEELIWTDPNTGQIYVVDARTGNSYRQSELPPVVSGSALPVVSQGRSLFRQKCRGAESVNKPATPEWIRKALEANDTYVVAESRIPNVTQDLGCLRSHKLSDYLRQGQANGDPTSASSHRFQKSDLRNAEVIDQVDRKFIACLVKDSTADTAATSQALTLIDQHAADERVRVERFLKELCLGYLANVNPSGNTENSLPLRELNPPVPVLLTQQEERQLRDNLVCHAFEHWGFYFVDPSPESTHKTEQGEDVGASDYCQVFVRSVPEVVADKLLMDDELRDLVKAFLAKAEDDPSTILQKPSELPSSGEDDEFYWLRALRWCPQQLLDLVNSKACRGAIMFNDPLTHAQCEKLVDNLSKTAFPFQCAHGRPSLVPLIDLGQGLSNNANRRILRWSSFRQV
ncbi:hypothetical protein GGX14DRAFT_412547 [Mycena pura]|uniref:MutL C-terminal dimerisation domain-containing protein n=1 Tax=Mycena pura TaxID=153505 RepID=A0AAD6YSM1_9AGAR|nr:hypothetical protein GGX14DRAFT_412547 [Mycena pura]